MEIRKTKPFKVDIKTSQILEICLRNGIEEFRWFLLQSGSVLAYGKEKDIYITRSDAWFLRDRIIPSVAIGQFTGLDVLKEIYKILVEFENESMLEELREMGISITEAQEPERKEVSKDGNERNEIRNNQNNTTDSGKDRAGGGPGTEIKS